VDDLRKRRKWPTGGAVDDLFDEIDALTAERDTVLACLDARTDESIAQANAIAKLTAERDEARKIAEAQEAGWLEAERRAWHQANPPRSAEQGEAMSTDEAEKIDAAHPLRTGRHDLWAEAMRLVGERHAKSDLVELVNWLLSENAKFSALAHQLCSQGIVDLATVGRLQAENAKLRAACEAAQAWGVARCLEHDETWPDVDAQLQEALGDK
jgi:hypothetical protein